MQGMMLSTWEALNMISELDKLHKSEFVSFAEEMLAYHLLGQ